MSALRVPGATPAPLSLAASANGGVSGRYDMKGADLKGSVPVSSISGRTLKVANVKSLISKESFSELMANKEKYWRDIDATKVDGDYQHFAGPLPKFNTVKNVFVTVRGATEFPVRGRKYAALPPQAHCENGRSWAYRTVRTGKPVTKGEPGKDDQVAHYRELTREEVNRYYGYNYKTDDPQGFVYFNHEGVQFIEKATAAKLAAQKATRKAKRAANRAARKAADLAAGKMPNASKKKAGKPKARQVTGVSDEERKQYLASLRLAGEMLKSAGRPALEQKTPPKEQKQGRGRGERKERKKRENSGSNGGSAAAKASAPAAASGPASASAVVPAPVANAGLGGMQRESKVYTVGWMRECARKADPEGKHPGWKALNGLIEPYRDELSINRLPEDVGSVVSDLGNPQLLAGFRDSGWN
jgi:hypothetical protein